MRIRGVLGVAACATVIGAALIAAPAPAACIDSVRWNGVHYHGVSLVSRAAHGAQLRGGVVPGCDDFIVVDENGRRVNEPPPDQPVDLVRIRGVDPRVALARRGDRRRAYLAPGFLVGLPSHPLHRRVFERRSSDESRSYRCTRRRTKVDGRVPWQPAFATRFVVGPEERPVDIAVDGLTRVSGSRRAGLPYVRRDDRLVVEGLRCRGAYAKVLARSLRIIRGG